MTTIYLTRHGETEWNLQHRPQGRKDSNLTELGREQAEWLNNKLIKDNINIDLIISSSSGRAMQTAEILRGNRNIEIIYNDNMMEISLGDVEGMHRDEILKKYPDYFNLWEKPQEYKPYGDGETLEQIVDRVSNELECIIEEHKGKDILLVTHAAVLKAISTYINGREIKDFWEGPYMRSTCLNILEVNDDSKTYIIEGDISHYKSDNNIFN